MIVTKQFKVKKTENLTAEYVETQLIGCDIVPLRWAIVGFDEQDYILDVSYEI